MSAHIYHAASDGFACHARSGAPVLSPAGTAWNALVSTGGTPHRRGASKNGGGGNKPMENLFRLMLTRPAVPRTRRTAAAFTRQGGWPVLVGVQ
ncbi:hypothetical protein H4W80_000407 [Nonomuraea angiospora]|uniref:DUF397 domain-containing protein n=1 Tax=Nonomuraea angiospora TaxID=46172 RepID=A0ABR9LNC3_9ACTN|nr:hypothetical protein [Nonomuraea angiospora]